MGRRFTRAVVVLAVLFAAAQFVRPAPTNAATDPGRTIQAALEATSALPAIVDRSCGDCHSNRTVSSWYTQVAPLSWLMARSVAEGRRAVNFSEWAGYPPAVQRALLSASCDAAASGRMPGPYTWFRPEATLSPLEIETLCVAARRP